MLGKIIGGLVIAGLGVALIVRTNFFLNSLGSIPFAERHLGSEGGSWLMYKLIGIALIFLGLMIATNLWEPLLKIFLPGLSSD